MSETDAGVLADEKIVRQFINDGANGNRARRALDRIMLAASSTPVRCDGDTLLLVKRALEQAQDCILGEAPPDITRKRAREDTLDKIGKAMVACADALEHPSVRREVAVWSRANLVNLMSAVSKSNLDLTEQALFGKIAEAITEHLEALQ